MLPTIISQARERLHLPSLQKHVAWVVGGEDQEKTSSDLSSFGSWQQEAASTTFKEAEIHVLPGTKTNIQYESHIQNPHKKNPRDDKVQKEEEDSVQNSRWQRKIEDIKYVRSHAQAIGQCQIIINKNKFKSIISADTAGSAKDLAEGSDKTIAAIASGLSAQIYKLKILEKNIEDEKGNVTRFLIMGKNIEQPEFRKEIFFITSCIFRLKSEPSALYKCLGGFATNQVNLTKLESFSVKNTFDQANFYLDLEGHLEQPRVKKAMEELGFHTETLDILGVYEASKFRQK